MGINIRTKGQTGEREICDFFNDIYKEAYVFLGKELPDVPIAQRNQNQSAVGGCDISNTCGYAIEVKRQEQLSINTWWNQCETSARNLKKLPVLLYRQSRKQWQVVLFMQPLRIYSTEPYPTIRSQISMDDFRKIFLAHAIEYIAATGSAT